MNVVVLKERREDAFPQPSPPTMLSPQQSEDPRSRRFAIALALSVLVHAGLFALFMFIPQQKAVVEKQPEIVLLELAALGKPEAEEVKPPAPPPPPEQKAPEPPPPVVEQAPPPPLPEIKPPPLPETPPAPKAEPLPPPPTVSVRPEPKPELPPPPAPKQPEPRPEAPPVAATPAPPETRERPAPGPAPSPPAEKPGKGIETGVAGGTSQAEMSRYITTLFTLIDAKKVYPPQSLHRHEEGTVIVKLKIAADGKLIDVSSPTEEPKRLVDASLEAVRKAAPFPPLPASLKQDQAEFQVPVVYKLQ